MEEQEQTQGLEQSESQTPDQDQEQREPESQEGRKGKKKEKEEVSLKQSILEFVVIIVVAIGLAALIINFVARPYEIPSGSMEDTIAIGDRVISEQVSYYGDNSPKQGDIVTFIDPEDSSRTLIKRCIATAGQTVDLIDGAVYVDGQPLNEPYTEGKPSKPLNGPANITYPYTVPDGCIWCMGDNRTNSSDSRYFGPVSVDNVTGRAFFVYWPIESIGFLE